MLLSIKPMYQHQSDSYYFKIGVSQLNLYTNLICIIYWVRAVGNTCTVKCKNGAQCMYQVDLNSLRLTSSFRLKSLDVLRPRQDLLNTASGKESTFHCCQSPNFQLMEASWCCLYMTCSFQPSYSLRLLSSSASISFTWNRIRAHENVWDNTQVGSTECIDCASTLHRFFFVVLVTSSNSQSVFKALPESDILHF